MTNAGEIKGIEAVVTTLTVGATTAVGDVIHLEADGKYDPVADADRVNLPWLLMQGQTVRSYVLLFGDV